MKLTLTNSSPDKTCYIGIGNQEPCDPIFVDVGPKEARTYEVTVEQAFAIRRVEATGAAREFRKHVHIATQP